MKDSTAGTKKIFNHYKLYWGIGIAERDASPPAFRYGTQRIELPPLNDGAAS